MKALRCLKNISVSSFLILVVLGFAFAATLGQSGRKKDQSKPEPKVRQGPVIDPNRPSGAPSPSNTTRPNQSKTGEDVDESDVIRVSSTLVPIPASVVDPSGQALTGLKLADFELWVDGEIRPLSDLTRAETPVRLALLFDNSGSLDFARDFEKTAAMRFFRRVLRAKDEAAIYSIETDSYLAQPLTHDIARLEQTILNFGRPSGSTSLFDAIIDAATYLRPYDGRRVLVIVSDGVETTSRADFATTLQHVLVDDCQIFVVQTGLYEGANLRALAAERRMEELAGQTGGAVFLPKSTSDLERAFEQIAADLAHQYVLSYYPGEQQREGRFHKIELKVKSRKDIRVRARRGYYSRKPTNVAAREW